MAPVSLGRVMVKIGKMGVVVVKLKLTYRLAERKRPPRQRPSSFCWRRGRSAGILMGRKGGRPEMSRPDIPKALIEEFCRKHHIRKLSVFGSYLREDFGSDSDIDFLVEFDREHIPGLLRLAGMERELSELLGGRKVDLRTVQDLSRYFRDQVVASAEVQYAE